LSSAELVVRDHEADLLDRLLPAPEQRVAGGADLHWTVLAAAGSARTERPISTRTVFARIVTAALLVMLVVVVAGAFASRRLAERQAVNEAAHTTDLIAESVIQPVLDDGILTSRPESMAKLAAAAPRVEAADIVRVKLWTPEGRIVFSNDSRLIGRTLPLAEDQRSVFTNPRTEAEVTDLSKPENRLEQERGKLLEVYRPVWTPNGQPLLFETYSRYTIVRERSGQMWRGLAGVTLTSLLVLVVFLIPLALRLMDGLRRAQAQREELLQRAVSASAEERGRIAGTLHDGPVQNLAATSFTLTVASGKARSAGDGAAADALLAAATEVRANIRGLRSLLFDIYPASLASSGLDGALSDLAGSVDGHGIAFRLALPVEPLPALKPDVEQLVFRIAQECLRNSAKHSRGSSGELRLSIEPDAVVLDVLDDGTGFDAETVLASPAEGHFGLRLMADLARQNGAELRVATRPGSGTHWQLRVRDAWTARSTRSKT
jgi:signal transduction histidine kinase